MVVYCFELLLLALMGLVALLYSLLVNWDHSLTIFAPPYRADEVIFHPFSLHVVAG